MQAEILKPLLSYLPCRQFFIIACRIGYSYLSRAAEKNQFCIEKGKLFLYLRRVSGIHLKIDS